MSKSHGHWIDSLSGKNSDLEKRFGVSPVRMSKSDGGTWQEDTQNRHDYERNMIEGARNDYDLRRTMEAAAMSGKKKASKLLDKGFTDVGDVRKWQNFSEKAAARHGQGGAFDSASDYMGLTKSMVKRDRTKQTAGYDESYASQSDLDNLKDEMSKVKSADEQAEEAQYEPSDRMKQAKERVAGYKDGVTTSGDNDEQRNEAANSFAKYKLNLG